MSRKKSRERDGFALIPRSVMESEAMKTAPHAAFRVLAILVLGNPQERNGTFACSDSYAARFGITSKDTLHRALDELVERGLIVKTRPGMKLKHWPTLYGVTWWKLYYRDGQPLDRPEEPTHAYLKYTPIVGVKHEHRTKKIHPDSRGNNTPIVGVKDPRLHPDLHPISTLLHPDSRGNSRILGSGAGVRQGTGKVLKLMRELPHLGDGDIAKITGESLEFVSQVRQRA